MPDGAGSVPGLLERSQQGELDGIFLGRAVDKLQQFLQLASMCQFPHLVPESLGVDPEIDQFVLVRIFMDPVEAGKVQAGNVTGDRFVGGQHELLDQLMRDVILNLLDRNRASILAEADLGFREIKIQGSLLEPLPAKGGRQLPHLFQFRGELGVRLAG